MRQNNLKEMLLLLLLIAAFNLFSQKKGCDLLQYSIQSDDFKNEFRFSKIDASKFVLFDKTSSFHSCDSLTFYDKILNYRQILFIIKLVPILEVLTK